MITTNLSLGIAIEKPKQNRAKFCCVVYSHKQELLLFMPLIWKYATYVSPLHSVVMKS